MSSVINNPKLSQASNALQVKNYTPDNTAHSSNTLHVIFEGGNAFSTTASSKIIVLADIEI